MFYAMTFFLEAFETSSIVASYTLLELAINSHVQDRLFEELHGAFGDKEDIDYDTLNNLSYLDKVLLESQRKYPAVYHMIRECTKTIDLDINGKTLTVETGTPVIIPVLSLHRDAKYYPEPDVFDPERFSDEVKQTRPQYTYMPFGEGPRICPGIRFGMVQIKLFIAHVVYNYRILRCEKTPEKLTFATGAFLAIPNEQEWIRIEKRKRDIGTTIHLDSLRARKLDLMSFLHELPTGEVTCPELLNLGVLDESQCVGGTERVRRLLTQPFIESRLASYRQSCSYHNCCYMSVLSSTCPPPAGSLERESSTTVPGRNKPIGYTRSFTTAIVYHAGYTLASVKRVVHPMLETGVQIISGSHAPHIHLAPTLQLNDRSKLFNDTTRRSTPQLVSRHRHLWGSISSLANLIVDRLGDKQSYGIYFCHDVKHECICVVFVSLLPQDVKHECRWGDSCLCKA
ncbi:hypothetical protein J6590_072070 [Homalodisca vitripennis]|nr:hypothetical protein J6590_072070 [Homalodisca vitripennis]